MAGVLSQRGKLMDVLDAVNKKHGAGTMARASRVAFSHLRRTSTGIFNLDLGLGGGLPKGRIIGFVGDESSCKTSTALMSIAEQQHTCRKCMEKFGWYTDERVDESTGEVKSENVVITQECPCGANEPHVAMLVDAEGSFDPIWAAQLGVDVPTLIVVQPEWGQQAVDLINATVRSGDLDMVVVDSIAHMTPAEEIEKSAQDVQVGALARIINKMMRTLQSGLNSLGMDNPNKPTIIVINQFREKVGVMYGDPTTWPGGKGQNFAYSALVIFKPGKVLAQDGKPKERFGPNDEKVGREINWHVRKNKVGIPEKRGVFSFFYSNAPEAGYSAGSVNNFEQIVLYGETLGVIGKGGAWYDLQSTFGEEYRNPVGKTGNFQGIDKLMEWLQANPDKAREVRARILHESKMQSSGAAA